MADNKQGKVAIPAKNIIQRIGEKSGPIASVGVPKRGYGTMSTQKPNISSAPRRDLLIAFLCGGVVAAMVGLSFAAVPFYSWFCRTTGFGGRPQIVSAGPGQELQRTVTIRFDANVGPGLPWRFEPERRTIDVKLGEVVTVVNCAK